jgi:hypothetical protein
MGKLACVLFLGWSLSAQILPGIFSGNPPVAPAITPVFSTGNSSTLGAAPPSGTVNITGSTVIVAFVDCFGCDTNPVFDDLGNTWTAASITHTPGASFPSWHLVYYSFPTHFGNDVFKNSGAGANLAVVGFGTFTSLDVTGTVTTFTGSPSTAQPGSVTPSAGTPRLLVAGLDWNDPATPLPTVDSGFTIFFSATGNPAVSYSIAGAWLTTSGGSAINPTWTLGSGSVSGAASLVVFK